MFQQVLRSDYSKKIIAFVAISQFVLTSMPMRTFAAGDHLRPAAARDNARVVDLEQTLRDGGSAADYAILVLSNIVSLFEGAQTGGYNLEHAISDDANGAIFNHSEPRLRLETQVSSLLKELNGDFYPGHGASKQQLDDFAKKLTVLTHLSADDAAGTIPLVVSALKFNDRISDSSDLARTIVNKVMNAQLKKTIKYAQTNPFAQTVLCAGETEAQYKAGLTQAVIKQDLSEMLEGISLADAKKIGLRIAYEPRWAIGTGLTPTLAEIDTTHKYIKSVTAGLALGEMDVDYGGSLNAKNCNDILSLDSVNGGLIGGAAKTIKDIEVIINAAIKIGQAKGKIFNIGMNWKAEDASTKLEQVAAFVELFKTKDLSKVRIVISTPQVKAVRTAMADLEKYMARTSPAAEALIAQLTRSLKDPQARAQALADIVAVGPGMKDYLDIMLIQEKGRIDAEQIAALRSRLIKELRPDVASKRIAIVGSSVVARLAAREIVSNGYDGLELVSVIGKPAAELFPGIVRDSQQGAFTGKAVIKDTFFYLGDQREAIKIINSDKDFSNIVPDMPWVALGVDVVIIDDAMFSKIGKDGVKAFQDKGMQVIVSRSKADATITYIPGMADEAQVQQELGIRVAATQDVAVATGVKALQELGNLLVINPSVMEPWYAQMPPTYKIPGSFQTGHFEESRFIDALTSKLGINKDVIMTTSVIKTAIPHGQMVGLNVIVDKKITKDQVNAIFANIAKTSDVIALPEKGMVLTSNLIWGEKRIFFTPENTYVTALPEGSQVQIFFFIDEDAAHVAHILQAVAQKSSTVAASTVAVEQEEAFAKSELLQNLAAAAQQKKDASSQKKTIAAVAKVKVVEDARASVLARIKPSSKFLFFTNKNEREGMILFGTDKPLSRVSVLRGADGSVAGLVGSRGDAVFGVNLMLPPKPEKLNEQYYADVQTALKNYYAALRDFALTISESNQYPGKGKLRKDQINVIDVYRPEEKLRAVFEVSASHPRNTVYKAIEQNIAGVWTAIAEPNMLINADDYVGKYAVAVNGAGGRIGSLWVREASAKAKDKMRIIAMGGPDSESLAQFYDRGDYVQGRFPGSIDHGTDSITLNGKQSAIFSSRVSSAFREPENYPWGTFIFTGVPVMLVEDATGVYIDENGINRHRQTGALRNWVSAPGKGEGFNDKTFVMNINHNKYNSAKHFFGSTASCTTGSYTMDNRVIEHAILKHTGVLDLDKFYGSDRAEKERMIMAAITKDMQLYGFMETDHALTEEGLAPDEVGPADKATRKRSASGNIIPTTTGAKAASNQVDLATVNVEGLAVRFPTEVVSLVRATYVLDGTYTAEEIVEAAHEIAEIARGLNIEDVDYSGQIKLVDEWRHMMSTISPSKVKVSHYTIDGKEKTYVKLPSWYENELYYAREAVDFAYFVMRVKETQPTMILNTNGRIILDGGSDIVMTKDAGVVTDGGTIPLLSTLTEKDLKGRTVLVRVDFNVSDDMGKIKSTKRIEEAVKTITYLSEKGATVVLTTHNGRPKGKVVPELSMDFKSGDPSYSIVSALEKVLKDKGFTIPVKFIAGSITDKGLAKDVKSQIQPGAINVLENTRFNKGEESNDPAFAKGLAALADNYMFVFDAFGTAERVHASTAGALKYMSRGAYGFLMEKENIYLDDAVQKLYGLIIGGGPKLEEKIIIVKRALENKRMPGGFLMVGSAPSQAFLELNYGVVLAKKSSDQELANGREMMDILAKNNMELVQPVDYIALDKDLNEKPDGKDTWIAKKEMPADTHQYTVTVEQLKAGSFVDPVTKATVQVNTLYIYDIGPQSRELFNSKIMATPKDRAVFYNGTVGVFEMKQFAAGGKAVDEALALAKEQNGAITVIGGGDTGKESEKNKVDKRVSHVSTGGGASLAKLKGEELEVEKAFKEKQAAIIATANSMTVQAVEYQDYQAADADVYAATGADALSQFADSAALPQVKALAQTDSRGKDTITAVLTVNGIVVYGDVPAGASTGMDEAKLLPVAVARHNIDTVIARILIDNKIDLRKHSDLRRAEQLIVEAAGKNFETLGANAVVPVSWAMWRAAAALNGMELWEYIRVNEPDAVADDPVYFYMNIYNGGKHAEKTGETLGVDRIDIQEIMISPVGAKSYAEALQMGDNIDQALKAILQGKFPAEAITRADEAGFSVKGLGKSEQAIAYVLEAIRAAGYIPGVDVKLCLDVAATSFLNEADGTYMFQGKSMSSDDMIAFYVKLAQQYKGLIVSIEDGLAENDWDGWVKLTAAMKEYGILTIGDDLFVTQHDRLNKGIPMKAATSILIKVNQNGSVGGTLDVMKTAKANGMKAIVSHRSGETTDDAIADLAYATKAFGLKTGDPQPRVDFKDEKQLVRRNKYERMVAIENQQQKKINSKALVISTEFLKIGGVNNALNAMAAALPSMKIALYGKNADKLKALFSDYDVVTAGAAKDAVTALNNKGVAAADMILLRSSDDAQGVPAQVKQIVARDVGVLAVAKAIKELFNIPVTDSLFKQLYQQLEGKVIVTQSDAAREALFAALDQGVFDFGDKVTLTDEVAGKVEQAQKDVAAFINKV